MSDATVDLRPAFQLIDRIVAQEGVPGAALAVAYCGEPVGTHFAGQAAPGEDAGPATLWPIASITKLFTAATVLALVERGVLALSTPVRRVLPDFDGEGREKITLRHLLTHTSGLIYESPRMEQLLIEKTPLDELVAEVYRTPLRFAPGEGQAYSDLGFALLGRVAATATGRPFPALMRELVLEPAGLEESFFGPKAEHAGRLAKVSGAMAEGTDGAIYNSPYALALAHPAFGVVASLGDLLRFGLCLTPRGRRVLSAAALATMTSDQVGDRAGMSGTVLPWGLGCEIRGNGAGFPVLASPASFGHGGATGCLLWIDPSHDAVVAFASNRHYRADPDGFTLLIERVTNATLACLTRHA
jgi:CubicO group peptidase (beta-lactamase class C family)